MGRLISIFLAFGLAAISLSGCQSVQQSAASAAYTCEAAGLRPGTRRFDRCQEANFAQNRAQSDEAATAVAAAAAAGVIGGAVIGAAASRPCSGYYGPRYYRPYYY